MVDTKTLTDLSDLAKQLNEQSDTLNGHIKTLNEQMSALNLGLKFWLDKPIERSGIVCYGESEFIPGCIEQGGEEQLTYLGYGKFEDDWQLLIQKKTSRYRFDEIRKVWVGVDIAKYAPTPLLRASRDLRLVALEAFDDLLKGLKDLAQTKIETMKRVGRLADPQ